MSDDIVKDELLAAIEARRELGEDMEPAVIDAFVGRIEQRLAHGVEESERSLQRKRAHQSEMVLASMAISVPLLAIAAIFTGLPGVIAVCVALVVIALVSAAESAASRAGPYRLRRTALTPSTTVPMTSSTPKPWAPGVVSLPEHDGGHADRDDQDGDEDARGVIVRRSSIRTTTSSPTDLPIARCTDALTGSRWRPSPWAMNEDSNGSPSIVPRTFTSPRVPKTSADRSQ